ncbi:FliG C-terminal domain-containing protein [uncultured Roseovarius sp.]|uniref:FliG C-terminal domain-containing protein n=1 Tax=uncultured Roseovarius sp. TaxID=293344 RepID=UPI0026158A18|nr:FliG C-terminal domain-containing protein [uncultured Roseovarius sp.]
MKPTDIPRITRELDQAILVTALAGAASGDVATVAEFILNNLGKRMAEAIREEMQERGRVRLRDAEEAMTAVVNAVRTLEAAGEISFVTPEDEEQSGD